MNLLEFLDIAALETHLDQKSHKGNNIFFETFERFYLKEKEIEVCSKCGTILDNASFKYINYDELFCINCIKNLRYIKQDFSNIAENSEKCSMHNNSELTYYCLDCKIKFCFFCFINGEYKGNHNKEHKVINLLNLIPSKYEIDNLINNIKEKNQFYEDIIDSINRWQRIMITKSNQLKQKLREEISILKKLILNYNQYFMNYTYLSLFKIVNKYITNNKNNELLNKFKNCFKFEEQTKILFELCNINKRINNKIIGKSIKNERFSSINGGIIDKINNNIYFKSNTKLLFLIKYNQQKKLRYKLSLCPTFKEKIYSVSISPKSQQIYACLMDKTIAKIFNYNLENQEITINEKDIRYETDKSTHFNKCINISNNYYATSDNIYIIIWEELKSGNFSIFEKFEIGNKTSDLLYINDINENYFISSQPNNKSITVFDIENLKEEKIITNIDSIDCCRCLLAYKNYIFINCIKGIALFFIKTKEIVQYIENYRELSSEKEIFLDINDNICILNKKRNYENNKEEFSVSILKYNLIYDSLEPFEESNEIIINGNFIKIISLSYEYLLLCQDHMYSIKEKT